MPPVKALPAKSHYQRCDKKALGFMTTDELKPLEELIGQERAVEALHFGIGIRREGYNIFALGPEGTGRHTLVHHFLSKKAATEPLPSDWCYVNNFAKPHKPRALELPPGRGAILRDDMKQLVEELVSAIPAVFEGEDYNTRKQAIEDQFQERNERAFEEIHKRARKQNISLLRTPAGMALGPMRDDHVLSTAEFHKLPKKEQERLQSAMESLQAELEETLQKVPLWNREKRENIRALDHEVTRFAVNHMIRDLREKYADTPEVTEYLDEVEQDIIASASDFITAAQEPDTSMPLPFIQQAPQPSFQRYMVNLLVDNRHHKPLLRRAT